MPLHLLNWSASLLDSLTEPCSIHHCQPSSFLSFFSCLDTGSLHFLPCPRHGPLEVSALPHFPVALHSEPQGLTPLPRFLFHKELTQRNRATEDVKGKRTTCKAETPIQGAPPPAQCSSSVLTPKLCTHQRKGREELHHLLLSPHMAFLFPGSHPPCPEAGKRSSTRLCDLSSVLWPLCFGQEATVRNGHEMTDWIQIGKGVSHPAYLIYMQSI